MFLANQFQLKKVKSFSKIIAEKYEIFQKLS